MKKFTTVFLQGVFDFFEALDIKVQAKILFNIEKAEDCIDPSLFKKLQEDIWEFRIKYGNLQYRLLAFWDKRDNQNTLVICTHGIIKKTDKMPKKEIDKATALMEEYFENQ